MAARAGWEDIENYGISKQTWLKDFLALPNGIPSDDTFRRVFEFIDPEALNQCFLNWVETIDLCSALFAFERTLTNFDLCCRPLLFRGCEATDISKKASEIMSLYDRKPSSRGGLIQELFDNKFKIRKKLDG